MSREPRPLRELTYVQPDDPPVKRFFISIVEDMAGRGKYLPLYEIWRKKCEANPDTMMQEMINIINVELELKSRSDWPAQLDDGEPLVIVANHPYGIADGIISLVIAEQLGRPYHVLINKDMMTIPEIRMRSLPIDFSQSREAVENNLKSRARARELLKQGHTIVVFPAGGVATAANPFGKAEELPWGTFPTRLIQQAKASVLPLYFEGQPGPLFHAASRVSQSLRMMLMVTEFRNFPGRQFNATAGEVVKFEDLPEADDRTALTNELYLMVHRLAPHAQGLSDDELLPTPRDLRPNYPWDEGGFY